MDLNYLLYFQLIVKLFALGHLTNRNIIVQVSDTTMLNRITMLVTKSILKNYHPKHL